MPDLMGIGLSGVKAQKTALATVSHNIVNVDTDGYSRQRVQLGTLGAQASGDLFIGSGTEIKSVFRNTNQFVTSQLWRDTQAHATFESYAEYATKLDTLLGDDSTGIAPTLLNFFNAVNDVANDPSSVPARQVLLGEGRALANRFNSVYEQIRLQNETLNRDLAAATSQVSKLAASVASMNEAIKTASSSGTGSFPNDLVDRREEAIRQLSELIGVDVVPQPDGSINVSVGSGQPLVVGAASFEIGAGTGETAISRNEVLLVSNNASQIITSQVSGGRIGGLLNVRNELIDPALNELGRLAMVIGNTINEQHQLGMDLNNQLGGLFFNDINSVEAQNGRVYSALENQGNIDISLTIDDVNALDITNYDLRYDSGTSTYRVTNLTTNAVVSTFAAPVAFPATISLASEGFSITMDVYDPGSLPTTHEEGDRYLLTPTRLGASDIGMHISTPQQVAAALPIRTTLPQTNVGSAIVERVEMTDTTTADFTTTPQQLTPPYRVVFTSPTSYDVFDMTNPGTPVLAGQGTYTPNQPNNLLTNPGLLPAPLAPGYDLVVNGAPESGDVIDIDYNNGGSGDNRNALLMSALQRAKTMGGGRASYQEAYAQLVGEVGTRTRDSRIGEEASDSILQQTTNQRNSITGVNLDEEAADLIRFQNAYQASARIIQVTSELFDVILGIR